ncbi:MAG TPA: methyltransferase domain-containing protein [Gemmatimonadota bacterium]|nr:methyltransferase domain-containing protein [Gemmatimonadota bacterium]
MPIDHVVYDKRKYPIVDVREGYGEWVRTYEETVHDEMDLRLLERLRTVDWASARDVVDLACGTGRIGAWLKGRGAGQIDGVDITPEMLELARGRGLYRTLRLTDVSATGLGGEAYDLCIQSLADEHLPGLDPLYEEVTRLTRPQGTFVIVGFHPQFLMAGVPTHFKRGPDDHVTIRSYVHLLSDHVRAARSRGWSLLEMEEGLVDGDWLAKGPRWERHAGQAISFAMVWRRG